MAENVMKLSVRRMVEFIMRSGDIDTAYLGANRALEGTRVHQKIQKKRKKEAKENNTTYNSEVYLSVECEHWDILFHVEGRADGVQTNGKTNETIIEEIKSTMRPVSSLEENMEHWHWAQAKCYGYMYIVSYKTDENLLIGGTGVDTTRSPISGQKPDGVTIQITYCHVETEEIRTFSTYFNFEALAAFFSSLIEQYWNYARMDIDRLAERNETAKALAFPYGTYRPGQRELAVAVFTAVKQKRKLFAQAPTGIGKTISTVFPAVKSLAEGHGEKIFYLTAKTIARQVAEDAFRHMTEKGLRMRVITLTARDKLCFCETRNCDPEYCSFAKGHFDRVNAAILDCVRNELIINRNTVEEYAHKHHVCPAEYQLDVSLFCDTVICDYNHAYDPKAKLQRFFQLGGDYILLNDEAHNLVDRAREMFSAGLYKNDFTALRRELGRRHPLYKSMGAISKEIRKQWEGSDREPFCRNTHPVELLPLLLDFAQHCDELFRENPNMPHNDALLTLYFTALDYLRVSELFDERYAFYCEPDNGYIRLFCLDPSWLLQQEQKKSRACVYFSATLTPLAYFRTLLGGDPGDYTLRLASPFPRSNLCLMVDDRISTRYKDRAASYETVADRLFCMVSGQTGQYMAFFPSYAYLTEVYTRFTDKYPQVKTQVQLQDMSDENREQFLADFSENPVETMLAFVVLGGVFSEGIDLKGNRLIGAAVVGVGLPLISAERNVIMDYYNRYGDTGFAFAYIYPGMNKVMQAAGRVIRTETDRGVVLLIDSRFTQHDYRSLFPQEWDGYLRLAGGKAISDQLDTFWNVACVKGIHTSKINQIMI